MKLKRKEITKDDALNIIESMNRKIKSKEWSGYISDFYINPDDIPTLNEFLKSSKTKYYLEENEWRIKLLLKQDYENYSFDFSLMWKAL